jgi:hypothetical protein
VNGGLIDPSLLDPSRILNTDIEGIITPILQIDVSLQSSAYKQYHAEKYSFIQGILLMFIFVLCIIGLDTEIGQYSKIRLLTQVELSLSCVCANTADSASYPLPAFSVPQDKEQIDIEVEEFFEGSERKCWKGDAMETSLIPGICRLVRVIQCERPCLGPSYSCG